MATASKVSLATMELDGAGAGISLDSQAILTTSIFRQTLVISTATTQLITTLNLCQQDSRHLVATPVVAVAIRTAVHSFRA